MEWPKISVVTPSYNQGEYLEQTILSVLGQNYPNLEYIVIDGGSTDDSVEILKKYDPFITYWVSEKDMGQSNAINKGFKKATGDILCWLNSDDMYLPGVLFEVAKQINPNKKQIYSGNCIQYSDHAGHVKAVATNITQYADTMHLEDADFLTQPSTFWTRQVWNEVGILDEKLHYVFDWDWFIRAKHANAEFKFTDRILSLYRQQPNFKTGTGGEKRLNEFIILYDQYGLTINSSLFKNLLNDKRKLQNNYIKRFRKILEFFGLKWSDYRFLTILYPTKYKTIERIKFYSIYNSI